jgi:SAM-dependent methyltransferase
MLPETHYNIEREFHDLWAKSEDPDDILVKESFEAPTALEARFIKSCMGDLKNKRILDFGSGLGESSVYFALQGADVTAIDISPEMSNACQALASKHGVCIKTITSAAEEAILPTNYFDFVYAGNLIHHLENRDEFFKIVHSALKPGGEFYSWDPLFYNPLINIYRILAHRVRTPTETPLRVSDFSLFKKHFSQASFNFFWLFGLSIFLKYFLVDRLHPSRVRYWKHVLKETPDTLWWWYPLAKIDRVLTKIPILNLLSWTVVMSGKKAN